MIPFVRTRWELEACLEAVDAQPARPPARPAPVGDGRGAVGRLPASPSTRRWGSTACRSDRNDLTQLMLGVDRDSEICAELFDEADEAVLDAIRRIIEASRDRRHHVVAVRPGTLQPARVRRVPGAPRHHVDLGEPRRRRPGPTVHRPRRAAISPGAGPGGVNRAQGRPRSPSSVGPTPPAPGHGPRDRPARPRPRAAGHTPLARAHRRPVVSTSPAQPRARRTSHSCRTQDSLLTPPRRH